MFSTMDQDWQIDQLADDATGEEYERRQLAWIVFALFIAGVIVAGWQAIEAIIG